MIVKTPTSSRRARSRWWHSPQQYQQDPDESGLLHHRDATAAASLDLGLLPLLASEVPLGGNKPSARGHGITSRSDLFLASREEDPLVPLLLVVRDAGLLAPKAPVEKLSVASRTA